MHSHHDEVLIAVAPNGARRSKKDHPALPISPQELADCALECLEAGAAMLHLHVRDEQGRHTIAPEYYEPALDAVTQVVGDQLLIQVTSESAARYDRHQQMSAMKSLAPECLSIALRELIPSQNAWEDAAAFLSHLGANGCLVQIILYAPEEVQQYAMLIEQGVIPSAGNFLLFVLGRDDPQQTSVQQLQKYIDANVSRHRWMCCAFGANEGATMEHVMRLGGHPRVGFENNIWLADGSLSESNAQAVRLAVQHAKQLGRGVATALQAREMF